jgi:hypothetical protein
VVHQPTAWHCVFAINSEDKLSVTSTSAPTCSVAPPLSFTALPFVAQPQELATSTSFPLEEPFSHNRQDESPDRASPPTAADGGERDHKETSCHFYKQ